MFFQSMPAGTSWGFSAAKRWSYSRASARTACAADTQWIVAFTFLLSGALPPRVAGS